MTHNIAILGASGYAGGELVRLVDGHPDFHVAYLGGHSSVGKSLGEVHPHLAGGDRVLGVNDASAVEGVDLAFLALPHGASAGPAMELLAAGVMVVDLGSDFRLDGPDRFEEAYGGAHPYPEELGAWAYGIPELFPNDITSSVKTAAPGCYPTSAILGLAPLLEAGLIEPHGLIVDSLSGVSGAGRGTSPDLHFGAVDENVRAYGVTTHRHRPEMEQVLTKSAGTEVSVVFTPHLVPMQRGILSTCYASPKVEVTEAAVRDALVAAYEKSSFVELIAEPPRTAWVVGSNRALISAHWDARTETVIVIVAIDNLLKGAAGQAVQCANLMLGLPEDSGLPLQGWMP